jgi:hypothetical protein
MPRSTLMTSLTPDEANPMGTDFVGGAEPLAARPGAPGQDVPGSDFAGGAMPLTAETNTSRSWTEFLRSDELVFHLPVRGPS